MRIADIGNPSEIDKDFESEIAEECSKFGRIRKTKVVVLKQTQNAEDQVLAFIEFSTPAGILTLISRNGKGYCGHEWQMVWWKENIGRKI